jgi:hypothetical protein
MAKFFGYELDDRLCMIEDMIERGEVYQGYRQSYTRPTRPTKPTKSKTKTRSER